MFTYIAAISACEMIRHPYNALELPKEMLQIGLEPDVIMYNASISAWVKARLPDTAFKLLGVMGQTGLQLNVIMYSAAIRACERGFSGNSGKTVVDITAL